MTGSAFSSPVSSVCGEPAGVKRNFGISPRPAAPFARFALAVAGAIAALTMSSVVMAEGYAGPNNIVKARCVGAKDGVSWLANNVVNADQCEARVRKYLGPSAGWRFYRDWTEIQGYWKILPAD